MKHSFKRAMSFLLSAALAVGVMAPATYAASSDQLIGDIAKGKYYGDFKAGEDAFIGGGDMTNFTKISHPNSPASQRKYDPTKSAADKAMHEKEVFADGLLDYIADGRLGVPGVDEGANGQGDRGQTYSWTGISYGDWMYVSTQYNSAGATGDLMGHPMDPNNLEELYGGDYWLSEHDGKVPGSTLSKINVKTGEVKILMSGKTNGLDAQFRSSIEFNGKLYFCGSVNHLPSIYEVDPTTDAFQCVYQDPSMKFHKGGLGAAWQEARYQKRICPAIRGLTTFGDYLVISCVGLDMNPYIAVSKDPSSGEFTIIASAWDDVEKKEKGELLGYPACRIPDSIFGGSIWEMVTFNDKLYVAMCTGTPDTAKTHPKKDPDTGEVILDANGQPIQVIDDMQPFAIVVGSHDASKPVEDPASWTWEPLIGDKADGAKYTFGIDPERTRAGACNLVVYGDHLYIGEYNDTQIAFQNMTDKEFTFLRRNMEQSISMYRMGPDENIEKVMGQPTEMFPEESILTNVKESGFGQKESQYIWQTRVFDGKLYMGTFDETMILYPLAKQAESMQGGKQSKINPELDAMTALAEESAAATFSSNNEETALFQEMLELSEAFEARKNVSVFNEVEEPEENVLLPESVVNAEAIVKVDSPASLFEALLAARELADNQGEELSITQRLANQFQYLKLQDEVANYLEGNEVPEFMTGAASTFAAGAPGMGGVNDDIIYVMQNLAGSIAGFDMYSFDGQGFKQLTRSGLGDPYNQGLRVFASNNDPANSWLCIGSANPFYGTQIWRMESRNLNKQIVDPKQEIVEVCFVDGEGNRVNPLPDPNNKDDQVPDHDKSRTIYVNEGATSVPLEKLNVLIPMDYQRVKTEDTEVAIQTAENGTKFVQVEVSKLEKKVTVNFIKDGKNFKSTTVVVPLSVRYLTAKHVSEVLPEGHRLADSHEKYAVEDAGGLHANVPIVEGTQTFTLTVEGGKGSGDYAVNEKVYIQAEVPAGSNFVEWVVVEEEPAPETVAEGTEEVEPEAKPAVELADPKAAKTSLIMPGQNVTVKAVFQEKGVYNVTVENGTTETATAHKGDMVAIKAVAPADMENPIFIKWTSANTPDGLRFTQYQSAETTFKMLGMDVTVTANFKPGFAVTMVNGTASVKGSEAAETVNAYEGQAVSITAAEPAENQVFDHWSFEPALTGENAIVDANSASTVFNMPAGSVTVTANYTEAYPVTVNGGEGSGTYAVGTEVTITAAQQEGKELESWTIEGVAIPEEQLTEESITFVMPANAVVATANFKEAVEPTTEPTAQPTTEPTTEPTAQPEPTTEPTAQPTTEPTAQPEPTTEPTAQPTTEPTAQPTTEPTAEPEKDKFTVSGTVTSWLDEEGEVTVSLLAAGQEEPVASTTVTGNTAEYTLEEVAAGNYTLEISKAGHATRGYAVTVEADAAQDAEIYPMGDVLMDGKVNTQDWMRIQDHLQAAENAEDEDSKLLTGYAYDLANVLPQDGLNTQDWMRIQDHLQNIDPLW